MADYGKCTFLFIHRQPMENIGLVALLLLVIVTDAKVTVSARHIQVNTIAEAEDVIERTGRERFESIAERVSLCPSKKRGGNIGSFTRDQLPPRLSPLAEYIFTDPPPRVGAILGPARTRLGSHVIEVTAYHDEGEGDDSDEM